MNATLHAAYYADQAVQRTVDVVENVPLARDTFRLRFRCPEIAQRIVPGQFLMLRLTGCNDPLIGRPLALYDVIDDREGQPEAIDVVYLAKGKLTTRLAAARPGLQLDVWGPLGNGFAPLPTAHLIMVAGGIGQTPFVTLAQEYLGRRRFGDARNAVPPRPGPALSATPDPSGASFGEPRRLSDAAGASFGATRVRGRVTLCYGARSADLLAGVEDFERAGVDVRLATEDGSRGHRGLVTEVLEQLLADGLGSEASSEASSDTSSAVMPPRRIVCCGPEPMMEAVAGVARRHEVPCHVSLETPMACGIGICFTCVAKVRDEHGAWDYKRTCVEGPVFDATRIEW